MECKNCGAENVEHAIFCAKCGTRIDGKTVCSSCGTAYLGNFCPQCGAKHKESAAAESRARRRVGFMSVCSCRRDHCRDSFQSEKLWRSA